MNIDELLNNNNDSQSESDNLSDNEDNEQFYHDQLDDDQQDYDVYNINESVINSIIRLRTSLEFFSLNTQHNVIPFNRLTNRILDTFMISTFITADDMYESLNDLENVKITLSEADFNKLYNITLTSNCNLNYCECTFNEIVNECLYKGDCHICLDTFKKGDNKVFLKCKHYFHKECIYKWLCCEKTNCPICRYDVRNELSTN